ncbi:MAG: polysaccharide biosynthesis/export family protein, partial [Alistipes sp.]|nr:polysaccharide biosynthesis/export family protein [Alistipes sp.]
MRSDVFRDVSDEEPETMMRSGRMNGTKGGSMTQGMTGQLQGASMAQLQNNPMLGQTGMTDPTLMNAYGADSYGAYGSYLMGRDTVGRRRVFGRSFFSGRTLTFEPNGNMATPADYRLGPGDEVIIDIWGANEDNIQEYISPEGNIMVKEIGPVYLSGLTVREAGERIRTLFARKYAGVSGDEPESQVRVTLGQIRTILIHVMGEVEVPGTYRLSAFSTVFHALYRAGGVTDIGTLRSVEVLRGGRRIAALDLYDFIFSGKFGQEVRLEEDDI